MILALDPGATTGWARGIDYAADGWGQVPDDNIWTLLENFYPSLIVIEDFVYRGRLNIDFTPVEVIGVVKEWARQHRTELVWQTPSQVKHFFTNDRLKEREVYQPGMPHAMDAMRHLCYYLEFGRKRDTPKTK